MRIVASGKNTHKLADLPEMSGHELLNIEATGQVDLVVINRDAMSLDQFTTTMAFSRQHGAKEVLIGTTLSDTSDQLRRWLLEHTPTNGVNVPPSQTPIDERIVEAKHREEQLVSEALAALEELTKTQSALKQAQTEIDSLLANKNTLELTLNQLRLEQHQALQDIEKRHSETIRDLNKRLAEYAERLDRANTPTPRTSAAAYSVYAQTKTLFFMLDMFLSTFLVGSSTPSDEVEHVAQNTLKKLTEVVDESAFLQSVLKELAHPVIITVTEIAKSNQKPTQPTQPE